MVSFKQLEAIYWVAQLGTFAAAAEKLHASESAISKRITELEAVFGVPLFDRSLRNARLLQRGEDVVEHAQLILAQRNQLLERMGRAELAVRRFRVGVTELVALTWLSRLVEKFRERYPRISFEPEVDLSTVLCEKLGAGAIDFAIVPPVFNRLGLSTVPLDEMELAWVCRPGTVPADSVLTLPQLAAFPILAQTGRSGVDMVYDTWFKQQRLAVRKTYAGNSLVALATLTASGVGVSYLPALYFRDHVARGLLQRMRLDPPSPAIRYHAVYREHDEIAGFCSEVAAMCVEVCNFAKPDDRAPTPPAADA